MPIRESSGPGVIGLSGQFQPPAAERVDARRDTYAAIHLHQSSALLDVQFEIGADTADDFRVSSEIVWAPAHRGQRLGEGVALIVTQG